jgi:ABC-type multidrug transport system fused ATPase/permease subunit
MKEGDKFALVGINGAGKTTIVKLMCGFYQPTEGRILINGIDTRELNIDKYFEQIAVVFQDAFTMSFSIAENISGLNSDTIDRDKIKNVLQKAGLMEKISKLEKGIDTYLNKDMDENGIQLSGGEVQKLMLARALYKEAKLLILDEPTAALDAIAESEMYEKYQSLLKGKTSLFISHRLASTRFCNHILFLENGKIKEEGTHDELLTLDRSYAEMFKVQSQYYKDGGDNNESQESIA